MAGANTALLIIFVIIGIVILFSFITLSKKQKQKKRSTKAEENYKAQLSVSEPQRIRFVELVSKCDARAFGLYFRLLAVAFLSLITLGIANPWLEVWVLKWITSKTVIDEKELTYTGTGGKLFAEKFKWLLLFIVTLGIYGFWLPSKILNYHISQLHFEVYF